MGYTVTARDPKTFTDDDIAERTVLSNRLAAETLPDDPPTPVELAIQSHRTMPERIRRFSFDARAGDGSLAGTAGVSIDPEHNENPEVLFVRLTVDPDHRRRGIGTSLLRELVDLAVSEGCTRLVANTNERRPAGSAFATAVGAVARSATHVNHLVIADVDRAMLQRWVTEGPGRAPDYEIIGWDNGTPDEYASAYVELVHVMNDAPRDDLELNDFTLTVEQLRETEDRMRSVGIEEWVLVARRMADGAFAGFHNVTRAPHNPAVVWIDSTGVRPEHRGHALGKWLKARMTLRIMDEWPEVRSIRTGNADSNDAMLGINREMGYVPLLAQTVWELQLADAQAYLARREPAGR